MEPRRLRRSARGRAALSGLCPVEIVRGGDRVVLIPVCDAWSPALLDLLNRPAEPLERPSRSQARSIDLD